MKVYKKAILPLSFQANGIASGIKRPGKLDLALLYSGIPAKAACQFTSNKIQAAPIRINKKYLKENKHFQAIIVNSGNANCFTGNRGLSDAEETTRILSKAAGIKKDSVLVASTGIIGKALPLLKIKKSIPKLVMGLSRYGIDKAKVAILTTDAFTKEITVKFNIGSQVITICGIAKGAGMIAPNMATMLCFILADARITQRALSRALRSSVDNSFNCITVDGCMSTNDTIIVLANGAKRNNLIDTGNKYFNLFLEALNTVCLELAKLIIRDAEGATKFIQIKVEKAKNFAQARGVALNIANSNLFKTAMYGENPNFGRIVAAIGASGVTVEEKDIKIRISPLYKKEINVGVSIKQGNACATVYTSDLTPEYIKINAEYN
ncbi:MAG: bifunctional glutamate N-acetyltransferase/amino-acid acetyltransferase ArgJ [Candidatus Omnitrophota bacterium]|nr:bifunctional glutamate N-acetyltransferase/amino-acid acetyltransferase ArgJ [Candidatus Omnitrophota bacterium]